MINELTIKGLKCFEEAEFHFKNLTLLAPFTTQIE